jgi:hypothetical protein
MALLVFQEDSPSETNFYKAGTLKRGGLIAERNSIVCIMVTFKF